MLLSFFRSAFDRRLRDAHDIADTLQLPVVGHLHSDTLAAVGRLGKEGHTQFDERDLESFRMLRHSVEFLGDESGCTVLITSPQAGEGKSTVALGLALAHVAAGRRTLLVECDLRRPVLTERLGLSEGPGLAQYLEGAAAPQDVVQTLRVSGTPDPAGHPRQLYVIAAGDSTPEPAELLGGERFGTFIEEVGSVYDAVIIDSTPLLSVVDALELAPRADKVIVCVRARQTTRDESVAAKAALARLPTRPTGVVVTGILDHDAGDYGYYTYAGSYAPQSKSASNGAAPVGSTTVV